MVGGRLFCRSVGLSVDSASSDTSSSSSSSSALVHSVWVFSVLCFGFLWCCIEGGTICDMVVVFRFHQRPTRRSEHARVRLQPPLEWGCKLASCWRVVGGRTLVSVRPVEFCEGGEGERERVGDLIERDGGRDDVGMLCLSLCTCAYGLCGGRITATQQQQQQYKMPPHCEMLATCQSPMGVVGKFSLPLNAQFAAHKELARVPARPFIPRVHMILLAVVAASSHRVGVIAQRRARQITHARKQRVRRTTRTETDIHKHMHTKHPL